LSTAPRLKARTGVSNAKNIQNTNYTLHINMPLEFAHLKRFENCERFKRTVACGKTIQYVDDMITKKVMANIK